jgi:hypothetical protein
MFVCWLCVTIDINKAKATFKMSHNLFCKSSNCFGVLTSRAFQAYVTSNFQPSPPRPQMAGTPRRRRVRVLAPHFRKGAVLDNPDYGEASKTIQ